LEYLRKALEKKFKKSIEQLADELVFKPLEMRDTRFVWDAEMDEKGNAYKINRNTKANAADDLLTTVEDLRKVFGLCDQRRRIIKGRL
jgi:CubicO group peptidase (beta-lactamase class C family)